MTTTVPSPATTPVTIPATIPVTTQPSPTTTVDDGVALDCTTGDDAPTGELETIPGTSEAVGSGTIRTYRIEVEVGLALDQDCLIRAVDRVLADPRSWIGDGGSGWRRVDSAAEVRIVLASPDLTDHMCLPLRTLGIYSCQHENQAVLNVYRWRVGSDDFADLRAYRAYQINHEVGHVLGHHHQGCPEPGALAPVMMQQTKDLAGCLPNPWPYPGAVGG